MTLKARSPDLNFNDIPKSYIDNPPDAIVLVPLCNEITYEYVQKILEIYPNTYIGIDLQGFIRKIDKDGNVLYVPDEEVINNMNNIIEIIGEKLILKGSEEEMKILANKSDINEVMEYFNDIRFKGISIMTLGEKGSMITAFGSKLLAIPAFKSDGVADETGAGDVYLAIFLYEFIVSDKSWAAVKDSAYFASAAASFLVEKMGPDGFETKTNVSERIKNKKYIP